MDENELKTGIDTQQLPPEMQQSDPCVVIIFAATGDLARRKLFPSFYKLMLDNKLPEYFAIIGLSTKCRDDEQFRDELKTSMNQNSKIKLDEDRKWEQFIKRVYFVSGDFTQLETFIKLKQRLLDVDALQQTRGNHLFLFATPPSIFETILKNLHEVQFIYKTPFFQHYGWSRIMVEKPFGHDLESARKLNELASKFLNENQIFRIDHYLGKETVQNILVLRFGNALFEPIWNCKYVDHVQITAKGVQRFESMKPASYATNKNTRFSTNATLFFNKSGIALSWRTI